MICLKAHWVNAPANCAYRGLVETRYVSALIAGAGHDLRSLRALYTDAKIQPNSLFKEIDEEARRAATAGLLFSEGTKAAFTLEFLNLG